MGKQVHIIKKQVYEINVAGYTKAINKQNEIQEWNLQFLLPALSHKLDSFSAGDEVVTIEKMELDIGNISENINEKEWVNKIMEQMDQEMSFIKSNTAPLQEPGIYRKDRLQFAIEQWIFFLVHGYLQDNNLFKDISGLKKELILIEEREKKDLVKSLNELQNSFQALYRIVVSCTSNELFFHLNLIEPHLSRIDWINTWQSIEFKTKQLYEELNLNDKAFSITNERQKIITGIIAQLLKTSGSSHYSPSQFRKMADEFSDSFLSERKKELSNKSVDVKSDMKMETLEEYDSEMPSKEMFVLSAGLCLAASFLPGFFKELLLTDGRIFNNETMQQHAIYLLHLLACEDEDATEDKLIIPKLLCGWPLQKACVNPYPLSEKEIIESQELLKAMIGHWTILKNTSPVGLQQTFLQRNGKLVIDDDRFLLQVEQRSLDVLLEQVPWNFHTIKLPWMKRPLIVEWY